MSGATADRSLQGRSQMGRSDRLVVKGECDDAAGDYDISEYAYANREALVNLENANVNIDNSNDVIIGPVTQFNVSGNVTIVQNGTTRDDGPEGKEGQREWGASAPVDEKCTNEKSIEPKKTAVGTIKAQAIAKLAKKKNTLLVTLGMSLLLTVSAITIYEILQYLVDNESDEPYYGDVLGNHTVYYRKEWGGQDPVRRIFLPHPVALVVISHSATKPCSTFATCSRRVRYLQDYYFSKGKDDVAFNFMIGGDGDIYVGRGWDVKNFHDQVISIGINFIGNFNVDRLNGSMVDAALLLLEQGLHLKKLATEYILVGHNQSSRQCSDSPGKNAYEVISTWDHFSSKVLYDDYMTMMAQRIELFFYDVFGT